MAKIEIDINRDRLAELGYSAFHAARSQADRAGPLIGIPTWEEANSDLRNFWRMWAAEFTTKLMLGD